MANPVSVARSNEFRVKDAEAFKSAMEEIPNIEVVERSGKFMVFGDDPDGCDWNTSSYVDDGDVEYHAEYDLADEISKHLEPDSVCILMDCGHEKLRSLWGFAEAINHKGERKSVNMNSIFELAKELGSDVGEF